MQNASLAVLTQGQIWSMHSNDSLWGCDGEEEDTVAPLNDADLPTSPETWLMLEFCDRGSLLVSVCAEALCCLPALGMLEKLLPDSLEASGYSLTALCRIVETSMAS